MAATGPAGPMGPPLGMAPGVGAGVLGAPLWQGQGFPGQVPNWPRAVGPVLGPDAANVPGGGGPEVLDVWEGFLANYRRYVVELATHVQRTTGVLPEADPMKPGLCAQALGGMRSDKVCMPFLTKSCRRGIRCVDRHPPDAQIEMHKSVLKRKVCHFGDQCVAQRCLFYHPRENGPGSVIALPGPPPLEPGAQGRIQSGTSAGSTAPVQPAGDQAIEAGADAAGGDANTGGPQAMADAGNVAGAGEQQPLPEPQALDGGAAAKTERSTSTAERHEAHADVADLPPAAGASCAGDGSSSTAGIDAGANPSFGGKDLTAGVAVGSGEVASVDAGPAAGGAADRAATARSDGAEAGGSGGAAPAGGEEPGALPAAAAPEEPAAAGV